jgi:hypothetical protein
LQKFQTPTIIPTIPEFVVNMNSKRTQDEMYDQIMADLAKCKIKWTDLSTSEVTDILSKIYDPTLSGPRFFYHQDEYGMPLAKISTLVDGTEIFCTVAETNTFAPQDWAKEPRPQGFSGKTWPPERLDHLIGSARLDEVCVCCDTQYQDCIDCSKGVLSEYFWEIWMNKIPICPVGNRGFGVIARELIEAETDICEFTGNIEPPGESFSADEGSYHTKIAIGSVVKEKITARIESLRTGSFGRFMNHSCALNCRCVEGRCDTSRIVYVETLRYIAAGEELTVDYGNEWYTDASQPCFCGELNCRRPPTTYMTTNDRYWKPRGRRSPRPARRSREIARGFF